MVESFPPLSQAFCRADLRWHLAIMVFSVFAEIWFFVVVNPVNSSWSVLSYDPGFSSYAEAYRYHGVALIYDPTISLNFKLALAFIKFDHRDKIKYWLQFHIYSSDTCSWSKSSEFIQWWLYMFGPGYSIWQSAQYKPCNIGGGSVCWMGSSGVLMGYDISTDTYWKTQLPLLINDARGTGDMPRGSGDMSGYDGIIYFTRMDYDIAKVWRLEGKNSWVVEDGSSEKLHQFVSHLFAYDHARRVLLVGDRTKRELFALHLSSSRLEILSQGDEIPKELFKSCQVAHGNTLASLRGAVTGMDGLVRELSALGFSPLDL